jgi:hypothetical protein
VRYKDGTEVREGDVVSIRSERSHVPGTVIKIFLPGTADACAWSIPDGGVMIEGGGLGMSVTRSLENDDEVIFVRRRPEEPGGESNQP